jgi:predicted nucleic acid-binding protein
MVNVVDPTLDLGKGESEAISLAIELNADEVLIDEKKARNVAIERGLRVIGTLGILDKAASNGLIDLHQAISKLKQTSFRATSEMIEELLKQHEERNPQRS